MTKYTTNFIEILEGCLLGDGCLEIGSTSKNACFKYRSSSKKHCEFVHKYFKMYCTENYQEVKRREYFDKRTNKTYVSYFFMTKSLPYFTSVYNKFYIDGKKVIPYDLQLSNLTNLFWYIGDGQLEQQGGYIKLHTNSFKKKEVQHLCNLLLKYEAKPLKKKKDTYLVTIPRKNVNLFLLNIGKCPIQDYSHKWNQVPYKKMSDGQKLYVTVHYAFNYEDSHWAHLTQFDILTQFFEHRNGLEGYVEDEQGARIEVGSEVDILTNTLYAAFENKNIPKVVEEYLLHFEMYEILAEYHSKPLSEDAQEYKNTLIETYDKV